MPQTIKAKECKFVVYVPPKERGESDLHLIKESVHYADGRIEPKVQLVKDYKRKFWITRQGYRTHKSKKEWEDLDKLIEYKSTQSKLQDAIQTAMRMQWFKGNMRKLCESPYIYGADINSTADIKKSYQDRYPDVISKFTIGVLDIETDVFDGKETILMASFTFKKVCYTAVLKSWLEGYPNPQERIERSMLKHLGEHVKARELVCETILVDTPVDIIKAVINKAHETKPDFLAIWNLDFEISHFITECERAKVDIAEIFSDPLVPKEHQYFKYKQGPKQKVTASGVVKPIKPAAQWHTVYCPSSFYIIDAMCAYKHIRVSKPEEPSYSLDAILQKELKDITKLKVEGTEHVTGLAWHQLMQTDYKIDYIVYNRFDCISLELLDEKTLDLSLTLPMFSGFSDFADFKSQPRRLVDNLHYYCLENNKVIGTTSASMVEEVDSETVSLKGWITTLPAHLVADNGLKCIEEYPDLPTNIRTHTGDDFLCPPTE